MNMGEIENLVEVDEKLLDWAKKFCGRLSLSRWERVKKIVWRMPVDPPGDRSADRAWAVLCVFDKCAPKVKE